MSHLIDDPGMERVIARILKHQAVEGAFQVWMSDGFVAPECLTLVSKSRTLNAMLNLETQIRI
jgi:hypothetical protein